MNEDTMKVQKETNGEGDTKERGLVGIRKNATAIVAWNICDNKNIQVNARKVSERAWHIDGYAAGTLRISATVFGGLNTTKRYVEAIRSGLTSRVMRRNHARRAANLSNLSNPN